MAVVDDISRGGVRLALENAAAGDHSEQQCVVLFKTPAGVVPSASRGWIRRTEHSGTRHYLAVEFTEPLVSLDPGASAASVTWPEQAL